MGLALHNYHDANGAFPPSGRVPGATNPTDKFVGWRALTLPHIEQEGLKELYNFDSNWWEGTNPTAGGRARQDLPLPQCSRADGCDLCHCQAASPGNEFFPVPLAPNDYEAIMGVQPASIDPVRYNSANRFSVMYRNSRTRVSDVLDGTSQTIMVVECAARPLVYNNGRIITTVANDQGIGWVDSEGPFSLDGSNSDGSAEGCTPANGCTYAINKRNNNEPYAFHPGGANMLFTDGHVVLLRDSISLPIMAALCTRMAGELIAVGSY